MPKAFYSTKEIAEIMEVKPSTAQCIMRALAMRGQAMKVGNRYRVRMTVFKRWLEEQGAGAA